MRRRVSARTLTTRAAAAREFAHYASPYVLLGAIAAPAVARWRLGEPGTQDFVALVLVAGAQPFVEYGLHRVVLHGPPRRVGRFVLDPGAAHRGHHSTPDDVGGALLGAGYAFADSALVAGALAMIAGLFVPLAGGYPIRGALTAITLGVMSLAAYEWCHLLVHTGYRGRSHWYRRIRAGHRSHHYRHDGSSFGVTSTLADRLFPIGRTAHPSAGAARHE